MSGLERVSHLFYIVMLKDGKKVSNKYEKTAPRLEQNGLMVRFINKRAISPFF